MTGERGQHESGSAPTSFTEVPSSRPSTLPPSFKPRPYRRMRSSPPPADAERPVRETDRHGTIGGYSTDCCRCEACTAAASELRRQYQGSKIVQLSALPVVKDPSVWDILMEAYEITQIVDGLPVLGDGSERDGLRPMDLFTAPRT